MKDRPIYEPERALRLRQGPGSGRLTTSGARPRRLCILRLVGFSAFDSANDPRNVFRPRLLAGESILWVGGPEVRPYALRGAWYLMPFSLLWGGFAIFWEVGVISSGAPFLFSIWGIPFVLIGLYMIFGRIFVARREAQRTMYGVTNQRILLMTGAFRPTFTEIALTDLPVIQLEEQGSGLGTITFGAGGGVFRVPPGWPTMGSYTRPLMFASIRDADRVYRTVQDAKAAARQT